MIPKGFISDMDGIAANSEPFWYEGLHKLLEEYGINLSKEDNSRFIDLPEEEDAKKIKDEYKIPLSEREILLRRRNYVLRAMKGNIKLNDGYKELLELMKKNSIKISLVSTSPMEIIEEVLTQTYIHNYFDNVISAREDKSEAYKRAVESMGLALLNCFALEDSPHGYETAKKAGLYCVVVPNPTLRAKKFQGANEVHETIKDFLQNGEILKSLKR